MSVIEKAKSYDIPKQEIWEAYRLVKANRGSAGIDGQSIEDFEENLEKNLYKIWNRMSSGSYFPPPVRGVEIPKANGGTRLLGIPTVADRIAQTVVKRFLEPILEPQFHADSYGYRPGKSAKDALTTTRQRCWRYDWVVDLDIKAFFDTIDHELLLRAVRKHTTCAWVLLYIERWLTAPMQKSDGSLMARDKGTPQGGVVSPVLANLFLHYAFDMWMQREHREIPFERYADDAVCHCQTEEQATQLKAALAQRFADCKLELHEQKTKIVYCADSNRKEKYPTVQFDFLGYSFMPRLLRGKRGCFSGYTPAISRRAAQAIRKTMRGWRFSRRTDLGIEDLARQVNPIFRGWLRYYGFFQRSALCCIELALKDHLATWAKRKFKRLASRKKARRWVADVIRNRPRLFACQGVRLAAIG